MAVRRLTGKANLADEIVDLLFDRKSPTEMVKLAKSLLDNTLGHECVGDLLAKMVAEICWEHGLCPPSEIKQWLI